MKRVSKRYLLFAVFIFLISALYGQDGNRAMRIGIGFGTGSQQFFPFNNTDYIHNTSAYRLLINYPLKIHRTIAFELQIEPAIFSVKHQLLNEYFVQPDQGGDYLEKRELFTKRRSFTEYALNVGIVFRYRSDKKMSFFMMGSVGPMISDTQTERLAKGFAFSDIIAAGITYKAGKVMFEVRPGLRHVSNANLQFPNCGHNSTNIDFGLFVKL